MPRTNTREDGCAYEGYAVDVYRKRHPDRIVFAPSIPDALFWAVTGKPVTRKALLKAKRYHEARTKQRVQRGKNTITISHRWGVDGVSVDRKAWMTHAGDLDALDVQLVEAKLGTANAKAMAGSVGVVKRCGWRTRLRTGTTWEPRAVLLSPRAPTAFLASFFPKGMLVHEKIDPPAETGPSTKAFQPMQWQTDAAQLTHAAWNSKEAAIVEAPMGMGKTAAAWLTLQGASDKLQLRIFAAHTLKVAKQARESALKDLGICATLVTSKTVAGLRAASDREAAEVKADEDRKTCRRIKKKLEGIVGRATAQEPAYVVLTHRALRLLEGGSALPQNAAFVVDECHLLWRNAAFEALCDASAERRVQFLSATPHDVPKARADSMRVVLKKTFADGVELGRLVPLHIEFVTVVDVESREVSDEASTLNLDRKAEAAAAWIVNGNLEKASVYTSRIEEADDFVKALGRAFDELGVSSECFSVHSRHSAADDDSNLANFSGAEFLKDGVSHRVVVSVGQLKEGWDCPSLDAVVLLQPPGNERAAKQIFGRPMRTHKGKAIARALVFDRKEMLAGMGKLVVDGKEDGKVSAFSYGVTADSYEGQLAISTIPEIRSKMMKAGDDLQEQVKRKQELLVCTADARLDAQVDAYIKTYLVPKKVPTRHAKGGRPRRRARLLRGGRRVQGWGGGLGPKGERMLARERATLVPPLRQAKGEALGRWV